MWSCRTRQRADKVTQIICTGAPPGSEDRRTNAPETRRSGSSCTHRPATVPPTGDTYPTPPTVERPWLRWLLASQNSTYGILHRTITQASVQSLPAILRQTVQVRHPEGQRAGHAHGSRIRDVENCVDCAQSRLFEQLEHVSLVFHGSCLRDEGRRWKRRERREVRRERRERWKRWKQRKLQRRKWRERLEWR
jgi:hypothetical protein